MLDHLLRACCFGARGQYTEEGPRRLRRGSQEVCWLASEIKGVHHAQETHSALSIASGALH